MKTRPSPDPRLRVSEVEGGRWTWCWSDPSTDLTLFSNETYASRDEACDWARRAYPDVPFADDES